MITVGSLFSGVGGFDLGLEWAGMSVRWQVEIDPFCNRVLAKRWPDVERFGDVKTVGAHNLPSVDLICGGFPCQPHSLAGKRRGAADDRDLWPECRRLVSELRPRWTLFENVPGIRTTILDQVLSDLENLDYTTGTLVIPACAFDLPHRRERVFIVAHTGRVGWGGRGNGNAGGSVGTLQAAGSGGPTERGVPACADAADPNRSDEGRRQQPQRGTDRRSADAPGNGAGWDVTDAERGGRGAQRDGLPQGEPGSGRAGLADGGAPATIPGESGLSQREGPTGERPYSATARSPWRQTVASLCGRDDVVPNRVDRLRALGNSVAPVVVEWIGRMIIAADTPSPTA